MFRSLAKAGTTMLGGAIGGAMARQSSLKDGSPLKKFIQKNRSIKNDGEDDNIATAIGGVAGLAVGHLMGNVVLGNGNPPAPSQPQPQTSGIGFVGSVIKNSLMLGGAVFGGALLFGVLNPKSTQQNQHNSNNSQQQQPATTASNNSHQQPTVTTWQIDQMG